MATAHLPLDPAIALLADFCATLGEPAPIRSIDVRFFVAPTLEQANGAKALAISEGVATAPKRPTANDRIKANAAAWGFDR